MTASPGPSRNDLGFAYVQTFTVEPGKQQAVLATYDRAFTEFARHLDGFVKSIVLRGQDDSTVVVLVQWRDRADFDRMHSSEAYRAFVDEHVRPVFHHTGAVHQAQTPCDVVAEYQGAPLTLSHVREGGREVNAARAAKRLKDEQVIEEFRANKGVVDVNRIFASVSFPSPPPLLLLHHKGRRTGATHVTVLGRLMDDDRFVLFAGSAGSDEHPDWYKNLLADPYALIDVGNQVIPVTAEVAQGSERDRLHRLVMEDPILGPSRAKLERMTSREIPVIVMTPRRVV